MDCCSIANTCMVSFLFSLSALITSLSVLYSQEIKKKLKKN